jgi:oligopeptide/dipeptide ABC transporter ATP-binding protein
MSTNALVETRGLTKHFLGRRSLLTRERKSVRAVDGVSLSIRERETLGVVGESGCGKTTLGRVILRLVEPTDGQVLFEGQDIAPLGAREMRKQRRHMQMVFQSPYDSFNPRFSVLTSLSEPLRTHTTLRGDALVSRASELLEQTGMPGEILYRYPHEFSGGQLQRIAMARALALSPKFIVLDEPTSALDVSVQAQIINLLEELQRELKLTFMFITHDLSVVQHISHRIAVMYLGKVVEISATEAIFHAAKHPYTRSLLSAAPSLDLEYRQERIILKGTVPDPANPPPGCSFHPRCPEAIDVCSQAEPAFIDAGGGHMVSCHLVSATES